jgi:3-(3-hydroxy-phenyl)propionate hydroxylase
VARHGNVEVLLSHELVDLADLGDSIALTVRDLARAQTRSIQARYLLACDGANSFVRRKLGISYEDLAFDEWWIVVDAWQRRPTAVPEMNTQYCWPSRPDCAHQMPPFLGQGMCAGIRDAANLIWKLLLVEKTGVPPAVLRTYQDERKTHVQNVVTQAKELGLIIGELDLAAANARDTRLRAERASGEPARHRLIPPLTRGLIDRDDAGASVKAAGSLFPQPRIETPDGRIALLDDVLPPAFLVVSDTVDIQAALGERELEILQRLGAVRVVLRSTTAIEAPKQDVITLRAKDDLFANWLVETGAMAAVVRPDRYVYGVARTAPDLARLVGDLEGALFG